MRPFRGFFHFLLVFDSSRKFSVFVASRNKGLEKVLAVPTCKTLAFFKSVSVLLMFHVCHAIK